MSEKVICDMDDLSAIANAVRSSTGSTQTYSVSELSDAAVSAISSGGGGSNVTIDDTLTLSGYAADAKATGDALDAKADADHTHTASEVGADASGSAASALAEAKSYTDNVANTTLSSAKAYADDAVDGYATETYVGEQIAAIDHPVESVNGKTGVVVLSASDVGADVSGAAAEALTEAKAYTDSEVQISTPVKGVDYWTEADQESIVQDVIAALGTPVFGTVDADNNIILSGNLADGTYTVKYEDADGNVVDIGTLDNGEPEPSYTNALLLAVDSDGTAYNGGTGWKDGYRLNSSKAETTDDAADVTGFIPAVWGDTLYLKNVVFDPNSANKTKTYIYMYKSDFSACSPYFRGDNGLDYGIENGGLVVGDDGYVKSIKLDGTTFTSYSNDTGDAVYVRFSCDEITDDSIVTVNEPIE